MCRVWLAFIAAWRRECLQVSWKKFSQRCAFRHARSARIFVHGSWMRVAASVVGKVWVSCLLLQWGTATPCCRVVPSPSYLLPLKQSSCETATGSCFHASAGQLRPPRLWRSARARGGRPVCVAYRLWPWADTATSQPTSRGMVCELDELILSEVLVTVSGR